MSDESNTSSSWQSSSVDSTESSNEPQNEGAAGIPPPPPPEENEKWEPPLPQLILDTNNLGGVLSFPRENFDMTCDSLVHALDLLEKLGNDQSLVQTVFIQSIEKPGHIVTHNEAVHLLDSLRRANLPQIAFASDRTRKADYSSKGNAKKLMHHIVIDSRFLPTDSQPKLRVKLDGLFLFSLMLNHLVWWYQMKLLVEKKTNAVSFKFQMLRAKKLWYKPQKALFRCQICRIEPQGAVVARSNTCLVISDSWVNDLIRNPAPAELDWRVTLLRNAPFKFPRQYRDYYEGTLDLSSKIVTPPHDE